MIDKRETFVLTIPSINSEGNKTGNDHVNVMLIEKFNILLLAINLQGSCVVPGHSICSC